MKENLAVSHSFPPSKYGNFLSFFSFTLVFNSLFQIKKIENKTLESAFEKRESESSSINALFYHFIQDQNLALEQLQNQILQTHPVNSSNGL